MKRHLRSPLRWSVFGTGVLAVLAIAAALSLVRNTESAPTPALHTVSATFLHGIELELGIPDVGSPIVSKEEAEAAARREYPNRRVLEAVLAHCVGPVLDETCWIISLPPAGLKSNAGAPSNPQTPREFRYLLVVIDAHTGEFVTSFSGT